MESVFWLILFVIFIVFELLTMGLTTVWFAGGALISFLLSLVDAPLIIQILVFFAVSGLLLYFTRPLASRCINKHTTKTNVDDLIGKTVKVTETIDNFNEMGIVVINGNDWTARTIQDGMVIPKDTAVQIVEIKGVKAIVQPMNYTNN
jgi:membrane protein implicated in regulation of membrane protease activity